jgi:hypothetical protein
LFPYIRHISYNTKGYFVKHTKTALFEAVFVC